MIDTASFLNSKDIADYWYKIGWNSYCTPLQSAYIIYKSREKSLKEKHAAWKELMETTPDCPFAEDSVKKGWGFPTLFQAAFMPFCGHIWRSKKDFTAT